jgi:signal recognition particle receptor subunit beta
MHCTAAIPLLVLGNKNDLPGAMSVEEIIEKWYVVRASAFPFF